MKFCSNDLIVLRSKYLLYLVALLLAPLGILLYSDYDFISSDTAEILYHVKEINSGIIPYRDSFTHHYLGFLLPLVLIDRFIPLDGHSLWIVAVLYNFITAIGVALCVSEILPQRYANLALLLGVSLGWIPEWQGVIFNVQTMTLPFLIFYIWAQVDFLKNGNGSSLYLGCFLAGALITFDQRLVPAAMVILAALLMRGVWPAKRETVIALVSFLSLPAVLFTWLILNGALNDFVFQTLLFPLIYRNAGNKQAAAWPFKLLLFALKTAPFLILLAALGLAVLIKKERKTGLLLSINLAALVLYLLIGGAGAPNYLMILVPLLLVLCVAGIEGVYSFSRRAGVLVTGLLLLLGFSVYLAPLQYYRATGKWRYQADERTFKETAEFIEEQTAPGVKILVWGYQPQIYLYSNRFSSFKDMGLITVTGTSSAGVAVNREGIVPEMLKEFNKMLSEQPPAIIVIYKPHAKRCGGFPKGCLKNYLDYAKYPEFSYFRCKLENSYRMVKEVEHEEDSAYVYKRIKGEEHGECKF
ncbi:MAG: hypothetical protein D6719_14005 [Candidatus Dadabacteria bacterium]|nr:MAG: hypothetical protein D6719_14005 [Candidatus Dadabacteria bacterium]